MRWPRQTVLYAAVLAVVAGSVSGCEDAAKTSVHAQVPALKPGNNRTAAAAQVDATVGELPLRKLTPEWMAALTPRVLDPKDYLIQQVEAKFAAGEQNYKAGHLEAARKDFDVAVDWLLESGLDPASDPRLSELFHRVVDTVYGYELQAFRAGDGFQEPPAVPAAIDEVAEMTFPVDPSLKARAEEAARNISHDMPLTVNDEVLSFLNFFQTPRGKAIVETGLRRSGRYREMISRVLHEEGVPQDLIYLAQAESAFQPLALSRAGARGMWQFVSYRGMEYGLRHTWWIDERQDPEKATRAAAQHLRDLYSQFGDWYLAMAAYNCGPGNVQKGIERTGYADFWELYRRHVLPKETRNYVPIILALTLIAKDAAHYGISTGDADQPVPTDIVKPGRAIDLRLVAETIDVDVDTLRNLNPALLRMATPDDSAFELHLPVGTSEKFSAEIADIPADKWVSWRRHRIETGETLTSIAKKYHVTAAAISEANNLDRHAELEAGGKLIIPAAPEAAAKSRLVRYRVRKGDTLGGIADRFSVAGEDVRKWNHLKTNRVGRGMVLRIYTVGGGPEAAHAHPTSKSPTKNHPAANASAANQTSASVHN